MLGRQMLSFIVHGTEIVERGVLPLVVKLVDWQAGDRVRTAPCV